ncbi:hypothetical protein AMJ80_11685, partial [bacterium SM23_31]
MHIAKFSVKNPVLVNLVLVSVLVLGTISLIDLPRDLTPNINFHWLIVVTTYSGVNPEEIEKLITIPLEDAINNVDNIKMVTSSSTEGVSQISVQFENMSDEKYDKLFQDLKSEVEKIDNLPEDIEGPEYVELTTDFMLPMIFVIISGTLPEREMKEIAEDLQRDILDIKHIARAELGGVRERQVRVEVDPERLSSYGLALNQVVNSIAMKNLNIPGGTMNVGRSEYILRTIGEVDRIEELSNVIIRQSVSGGRVAVKDVAAVLDTLEDAQTLGRLNGKTAITLIIS